jgi:hypothetical protein
MGLALEVGILADLKARDTQGFAYHADVFKRLNSLLAARGLSQHNEPDNCQVWSGEMMGHSGLDDVRRIGAHLDCDGSLPAPSKGEDRTDPCLAEYYAVANREQPSLVRRFFGRARRYRRQFDHLILHGDAEGYYLPMDFNHVLFSPEELEIPGGMVGSVPRLLAELDRIAEALGIPEDLTEASDELLEAVTAPSSDGKLWRRYGRESFGCVTLREGCRKALAAGAALVFT